MGSWDVRAFTPPAPAGLTPTALPAGVHFNIFIATPMDALKHGMENAPCPFCTTTVQVLRLALEKVEKQVRAYL